MQFTIATLPATLPALSTLVSATAVTRNVAASSIAAAVNATAMAPALGKSYCDGIGSAFTIFTERWGYDDDTSKTGCGRVCSTIYVAPAAPTSSPGPVTLAASTART